MIINNKNRKEKNEHDWNGSNYDDDNDKYKAPFVHPPIGTDFGDKMDDDEYSKDISYNDNNNNNTMSPKDNGDINKSLPKWYKYVDERSDGSNDDEDIESAPDIVMMNTKMMNRI